MQSSRAVAALASATVVGVVAGFGLHAYAGQFPLAAPSTSENPGNPTGQGEPGEPATPAPATPEPPATPIKGEQPAPFTESALLQPENFNEHNWVNTRRTSMEAALPSRQITSCTTVEPGDGTVLSAYSGTSEGLVTVAGQVVARFPSESEAESAMTKIGERLGACTSQAKGEPPLTSEPKDAPASDQVDRVQLWRTRAADGSVLGVVGVVRDGDRLTLLSLTSPRPGNPKVQDPMETTYVDPLYVYAGRRLN